MSTNNFAGIIVTFSLLASSSFAWGGTPRERALAAVAVTRAIVQVAADVPLLPDTPPRRTIPNPREAQDATDGRDATRVVPMRFVPATPRPSDQQPSLDSSMRLKATIFTGEDEYGVGWCRNCIRLKRDWESGDRRIELDWSSAKASGPQIYPAIRFVDQSGQQRFPADANGDYQAFSQLDALIDLLTRHQHPVPDRDIAQSGFGGSLLARDQIRQALAWYRDSIGENVQIELQWHRTGGQTFPLLAKGDWSATALFGSYGHMQVSATGPTRWPVPAAGFTYRITGNDVAFDMDSFTIPGLALQLGPASHHPGPLKLSEAAPAPSQFGLVSVWTMVSIARDVWSLLHPSCDLQLGGSVTATAEFKDNALTIVFDKMPSVRIVALFTFQLGVQRVVISDTNVHVDFVGSRLIKSRDFRVE